MGGVYMSSKDKEDGEYENDFSKVPLARLTKFNLPTIYCVWICIWNR